MTFYGKCVLHREMICQLDSKVKLIINNLVTYFNINDNLKLNIAFTFWFTLAICLSLISIR